MRTDALKNRLLAVLWTALLSVTVSTSIGAPTDPDGSASVEALDCVINPSVVADLGSGVPGILNSIAVDRSDLVKAGDLIAELESTVEMTALELAQARAEMDAEVKLRQVNAGFGRRQRNRTEDLFQRKAISTNDMDERNTEARLASIQLRQAIDNKKLAELDRQRAEHVLRRRTIKSPIDGVVMERFKAVGEYVEDQPVVRIAQLNPLYVEVFVPVEHLGKIRPGMQAEVWSESVTDKRWQAQVSRVDRVADVASGTYGVRLELPNADYTVPAGLRCQLTFLDSPSVASAVDGLVDPIVRPAAPKAVAASAGASDKVAQLSAPSTPVRKADIDTSAAVVAAVPVQPKAGPQLQPVSAEAIVEVPTTKIVDRIEPLPAIDDAPAQNAIVAADSLPLCHLVGPFKTKRQAKGEARLMRKNGFVVILEHQEKKVQIGHKVASKPLQGRAAARQMLRTLRRAGFTDLYLPRRHEIPARVYLGLYRKHRDAQQHVAKLAKKGFETELLPWQDSINEFFLLARKVAEDGAAAARVSGANALDSSQACAKFASR